MILETQGKALHRPDEGGPGTVAHRARGRRKTSLRNLRQRRPYRAGAGEVSRKAAGGRATGSLRCPRNAPVVDPGQSPCVVVPMARASSRGRAPTCLRKK
jgi:hypothetical protein